MEKAQVSEWAEAQKIRVSVDLVEAAKTHLKFLAAVDHRNRFLYEDETLQRAIYRYNAFWLPLLAKHSKNPVSEDPLVVPLDCELIWHCHRLNPLRYKVDCQKLYGRILTNHKVISSIEATSKSATEEIWNKMYPEEPYELDLRRPFSEDVLKTRSENIKFTSYDLIAAVKRQMNFTYQACRPHMSDELFLREAEGRYKGFLHIIRTNRKTKSESFNVPTYDIDLMWHTHQLYPVAYCKDTIELVGSVIQHDDSDSDNSKGSKLDIGYQDTTQQWQQMFGSSYWKAGAMSKGKIPTPVTQAPYKSNVEANELDSSEKIGSEIQLPTANAVEVILEFADVKNLPQEKKENLLVGISKKDHLDKVFNGRRWLGISSASEEKMFAYFKCEPKGEFLFELVSYSPTSDELKPNKAMKALGSCSFSFEDLVASRSQLSISKWVSVDLVPGIENSEPVQLHVLMSFSPPVPAPQMFQLVQCKTKKNDDIQAHVLDYSGENIFTLLKRNIIKDATKCTSDFLTEVYYITDSGEKQSLVEFDGNCWSFKGTRGSFKLQNGSAKDDSLMKLVGSEMVKVFSGRRLEFEPKNSDDGMSEQDFKTVVEFSTEYPYGRAVALINSKTGTVKTVDESIALTGLALTFILSDIPKEEELGDFNALGKENLVSTEGAQCQGLKCVGRCGGCVDLASDNLAQCQGLKCVGRCGGCVDLASDKGAQCQGLKCVGRCGGCVDLASDKGAQCQGLKCVGRCGGCVDLASDNLAQSGGWGAFGPGKDKLVKSADCACGPCKKGLPMNESFGAQCIGQCTNCGDTWKTAQMVNDEYVEIGVVHTDATLPYVTAQV
ncbi:hypothetical protein vseg_004977 [Gypsophila vaccaria]